ncbi:MAG: hypothetical protein RIS75_624 [Actinomycetota bacterium]|jgi:simple sugar transport system permease protein
MSNFIKNNLRTILIVAAIVIAYYIFFFVSPTKATSMLNFSWSYAIPLVLAAMVGLVGERSGVVNIGIEGQMLFSAFAGFFTAAYTGSLYAGVLAGILGGVLMGAFLAWTTVKWQMDQIIAGVVLNIVATGVTSFYYKQGQILPATMQDFDVPLLSSIPLVGPVFFRGGVFALATIVIVLTLQYMLFHTRWGLRTRAIGEYPNAADTAGINVIAMRLVNVTLAGALAGAAGAYLSMEATSSFERGFTAGRGFLALAILIFGAWHPLRVASAALFFGFSTALAAQLQADEVINIPQQFINILPFVMTLIVLATAAGRVRPPAASGQPFVKGGA